MLQVQLEQELIIALMGAGAAIAAALPPAQTDSSGAVSLCLAFILNHLAFQMG